MEPLAPPLAPVRSASLQPARSSVPATRPRPGFLAVAALALCLAGALAAQAPSGAAQAAAALAGLLRAPLNDVTLRGTVTRTTGGDTETGDCVLEARGASQSRVTLTFNGVAKTTVIDDSGPSPAGTRRDGSGARQAIALHNLWTPAVWFLPELSGLSEAGKPEARFTPESDATLAGRPVTRLSFFEARSVGDDGFSRLAERLGTVVYDLDPRTTRPLAARWSTHPENDYNRSIPVEVRWSDYRDVNGVAIPFHIQKFYNGTLLLDIAITSAQINTNPPATDFAVR